MKIDPDDYFLNMFTVYSYKMTVKINQIIKISYSLNKKPDVFKDFGCI